MVEASRWRESLLIYAVGLLQLAVMLVFYVSARQRLVLLPVAIYLAMVALEALVDAGRRAIPWLLLTALITGTLLLGGDPLHDEI